MSQPDIDALVERAIAVAPEHTRTDVIDSTISAIAEEWPTDNAAGIHNYALYLIHDCRDLAKQLNAIADIAEGEGWEER